MGNSHTLQKVGAVVTALFPSLVLPILAHYFLQFLPLLDPGLLCYHWSNLAVLLSAPP